MHDSAIEGFINNLELILTGWIVEPIGNSTNVLNKCTLVIPTYRRLKSIISLLEQLTTMVEVPSEVIIVDGTPERNVENQILAWVAGKALTFQLKYIRSPNGLTLQRNVGVGASHGDIIFFLDDDCVPQEGYFKAIYRVFEEDTSKIIGGVGGSITNEMYRPLSFRWRLRRWLNIVPKNGIPGKYYPNATSVPRGLMPIFTGNITTDILPGGLQHIGKKFFMAQQFSEFFKGYAQGEDLEMSLRLRNNWQLFWCGDAHVLHLHTPTGRLQPYAKGKMEVINRHFIWKRHTPNLSIIVRIKFWSDVVLIALLDFARFLIKTVENPTIFTF